jgi:hypothetical protein
MSMGWNGDVAAGTSAEHHTFSGCRCELPGADYEPRGFQRQTACQGRRKGESEGWSCMNEASPTLQRAGRAGVHGGKRRIQTRVPSAGGKVQGSRQSFAAWGTGQGGKSPARGFQHQSSLCCKARGSGPTRSRFWAWATQVPNTSAVSGSQRRATMFWPSAGGVLKMSFQADMDGKSRGGQQGGAAAPRGPHYS